MFSYKFGLKDKIFFLKELSYLLNGGVSIPIALETIANNTEKESVKYVCNEIYKLIKRGETLSRALTALDDFFNEGDTRIIASGEAIGELPKILKQLADEYENLYLVKMKYMTAMVYPLILIFIIFVALVVIFKYILPGFLNIVSSFPGAQLPSTTLILIKINNFIQNYGVQFFFLLLIVLIIFSLFISTEEGQRTFSSILLKFPILGKIFRLYYLVYFLRYFSLLIYSGLPITKVFLYLKGVMKNPRYKDMCDEILLSLSKGESFVPVLKKYKDIIPSDVVVLLKVGEETANLQEAAKNAILLYEEEFNKIVDNLSKVIEPILIVFVGTIIGFVALSIFSVIISVLNSLQV